MIVFTASDLKELNTQTPLSKDVPFDGDVSFIVTNISPAFFNVLDDLGKVQAIIPPWQIVQGNFNRNSLTLTVTVNYDLPLANSASASASQYALDVEVSNAATTPFSTQLPYANGVTQFSNVTNSSINVAGSVDANITNADLTITGGVNATVTNASLNVDVPNGVNVTNSSISVTPTPGSTIEVANTIDANLTGASVTIDTNTINEQLRTTGVVKKQTVLPVSNLAPGASIGSGDLIFDETLIDGYHVYLVSANYLAGNYYKIQPNGSGLWLSEGEIGSGNNPYTGVGTVSPASSTGSGVDYGFFTISTPSVGGVFSINIVNNTASTIVSDTVTLTVYGRIASQTIVNQSSNPVNTQGVQGYPTASGYTNLDSGNSWNVTFPALANTTITSLTVSGQWQGSAAATDTTAIVITSNNLSGYIAFFPVTGTQPTGFWTPYIINFGDGITLGSNGINIYLLGGEYDVIVSIFATLK